MINLFQLSSYTPVQQQNYTYSQSQNSSLAQSSIFDSLFNTVQPAIVAQQDNSGSLNLLLTLILKLLLNKQTTSSSETLTADKTGTGTVSNAKNANIATVNNTFKQLMVNSELSELSTKRNDAVNEYYADHQKTGVYDKSKRDLMDKAGKDLLVARSEQEKDITNYALSADVFKPDLTNVASMVNQLSCGSYGYAFYEKHSSSQGATGNQQTDSKNHTTINKASLVKMLTSNATDGRLDFATGEKEVPKKTIYTKDYAVNNIKNDRFLLENFDTLDSWYNNAEGGLPGEGFVDSTGKPVESANKVLLKILNDKYNMNLSESDASMILSNGKGLTGTDKTRFEELNKKFLAAQDNYQTTISIGNLNNGHKTPIVQINPDDGTLETKSDTSDDFIVKTTKK